VSLTLHDANGGNSKLKELIPDLSIQIGGLTMHSNFWVSTDCPLDILLGCPWQCHNFVLIDERLDGTYLRFSYVNGKDNQTLEILIQLLASKNGSTPLITGGCSSTRSYLGIVVESGTGNEVAMKVHPKNEAVV